MHLCCISYMIAFVAMTAPKQGFQILLHACCLDSSLPPPLTFQMAGIEARGEDSKTLCKARNEKRGRSGIESFH